VVKEHTVATSITDFTGKAGFGSLQTGSRFLFGIFQTEYTIGIWNLPIEIPPGVQESLTLDNNNAVYIGNRWGKRYPSISQPKRKEV
jgi:hypothetical protein